jgi:hypothetical protein
MAKKTTAKAAQYDVRAAQNKLLQDAGFTGKEVPIKVEVLNRAWALLHTREWPVSMFLDLGIVRAAFDEAIAKGGQDEAQGSN